MRSITSCHTRTCIPYAIPFFWSAPSCAPTHFGLVSAYNSALMFKLSSMLVSSRVPSLRILLPGNVAPSRHMVEPQSPLRHVSSLDLTRNNRSYIPKVGNNLVTTVGLLLVLLRCPFRDLELVRIIHTVGTVGTTTNLAAICAVAENLYSGQ